MDKQPVSDQSLSVPLENIIPVSKARANFSSLIDKVKVKQMLIVSKKYQPQAALVDINFLEKLLRIRRLWQRKQNFESLEKIREQLPVLPAKEVMPDVKEALAQTRRQSH